MTPTVSVIIPTYDRPARLAACLRAVAALDYPADRLEAVVVDDGNPTPVAPAVAPVRGRLAVRLVRQPNAGPAAARNAGAAAAGGDVLAFTDDDCAPDPGWLRALAGRLAEAPGALVGGRTVNALPANRYAAASQAMVSYIYGYLNADPGRARFFASNNFACPRARFAELGGFDPAFRRAAGEDRDFCDRWVGRGWPAVAAPAAVVRHAHPLTLRGFWRQHYNYGAGAYTYHVRRAARGGGRVRVEPPRFYAGLLRHPLTAPAGGGPPAVALMAVAQAANAAGFLAERWRAGRGG